MREAVGLIEVFGLSTAFYAADAACKAADITIEAFDRNKPPNADQLLVPLLIMIKLRGSVEDVKAGMEVAIQAANQVGGVLSSRVIAKPDEKLEEILRISCLG